MMLLAFWFLNQTLGFALPALPSLPEQDVLLRAAGEQNKLGNHGCDGDSPSCVVYDAEMPPVTRQALTDSVGMGPTSPGYDSRSGYHTHEQRRDDWIMSGVQSGKASDCSREGNRQLLCRLRGLRS